MEAGGGAGKKKELKDDGILFVSDFLFLESFDSIYYINLFPWQSKSPTFLFIFFYDSLDQLP